MTATDSDPSMHPADYIDQSQAILSFVSLMVGGYNGELALEQQDCHGLMLILDLAESNLKKALTKL